MLYCPVSHIIRDILIDILVYDEHSLTTENRSVSARHTSRSISKRILSFCFPLNFCCLQRKLQRTWFSLWSILCVLLNRQQLMSRPFFWKLPSVRIARTIAFIRDTLSCNAVIFCLCTRVLANVQVECVAFLPRVRVVPGSDSEDGFQPRSRRAN
jgi:hypothetical protein